MDPVVEAAVRGRVSLGGFAVLWMLTMLTAALAQSKGDLPTPVAVQPLRPRGIRFAVPDMPGVDLVIVNANINVPIDKKESGKVSGSATKGAGGYWIVEDDNVQLKTGDVIFYWIYISKKRRETYTSGRYIVTELADPSCGITVTTVNNRPVCQGQLIFEENFDTLDTARWKHSIQFSDDPDLEFCSYTRNPANSYVRNGTLHIRASLLNEEDQYVPLKLEDCTFQRGGRYCERNPIGWDIRPPTDSAWLTTRGTFHFKYGRVEIRAKPAVGDWLLSKLWLEPQEFLYGPYPYDSGRIEIARVQGNEDLKNPDGSQTGSIRVQSRCSAATCYRVYFFTGDLDRPNGAKWTDAMHIFTVTWGVGKVTFEVDGEKVTTVVAPEGGFLNHDYFSKDCSNSAWESGTTMAPFDHEYFINLSLEVGGFHIFGDGTTSNGRTKPWTDRSIKAATQFWKAKDEWYDTWKNDMEVDYVKVWAL